MKYLVAVGWLVDQPEFKVWHNSDYFVAKGLELVQFRNLGGMPISICRSQLAENTILAETKSANNIFMTEPNMRTRVYGEEGEGYWEILEIADREEILLLKQGDFYGYRIKFNGYEPPTVRYDKIF